MIGLWKVFVCLLLCGMLVVIYVVIYLFFGLVCFVGWCCFVENYVFGGNYCFDCDGKIGEYYGNGYGVEVECD